MAEELLKGKNTVEAVIDGKLTEVEIEVTDILLGDLRCNYCKGEHTIYRCIRKRKYTIGKIGSFTIDEQCGYCQMTKMFYMTTHDIAINRSKYIEALNKEIELLEKDYSLYSVFRHYSLTNKSTYTNTVQIGITTDYDEAIDMIRKDKKLFSEYATKELNEIPDNYKGFYTGGKASKRLTYSISLGCSFIINPGGDKENG